MTDISELRKDDMIIFSDGHESHVLEIEDCGVDLHICFINRFGKKQGLYFLTKTGRAPGTDYEIVKVIKHV